MDLENRYGTLNVQKTTFELLKKFSSFAKENNFSYSLVDGSMLGAVRHHGFIPWDDDVDIIVDRQTFNKLIDFDFSNEDIYLFRDLWLARIQPKNIEDYEVIPTIDIVTLDNAPSNSFLRKIKVFLIYMMQGMMKEEFNLKDVGFVMKLCLIGTRLMGMPFSYERKYRWYEKISSLWAGKEYSQCYNTVFNYIPVFFDGDVMENLVEVPFEDITQPIMSKYDHWLTRRFGDYMKPPKMEDRIPRHESVKYNKKKQA